MSWSQTGTPASGTSSSATTYASSTDLDNQFGSGNIDHWSNLDNDDTSRNTTRVDAALAHADEYIDDRFRGSMYAVPFSGTIPLVIVRWAAIIAGEWLYSSRGQLDDNEEGNKFTDKLETVDRGISEYLAGQKEFTGDQPLSHSNMPTAPIVVE